MKFLKILPAVAALLLAAVPLAAGNTRAETLADQINAYFKGSPARPILSTLTTAAKPTVRKKSGRNNMWGSTVAIGSKNSAWELKTNRQQPSSSGYLYLEMARSKDTEDAFGVLEFERGQLRFSLLPDKKRHYYNIQLQHPDGRELGNLTGVWFSDARESAILHDFEFRSTPGGGPEIRILASGLSNTFNHPGDEAEFFVQFYNQGGAAADDLSYDSLRFPGKIDTGEIESNRKIPAIPPQNFLTQTFRLSARSPLDGKYHLKLKGKSAPDDNAVRGTVEFTRYDSGTVQSEARPIATELPVGAIYRTGRGRADDWEQVRERSPERRPLYGWYREDAPEYIEWQIKHLTENGISFLLADWYWNGGLRKNIRWEQAFANASNRSHLRWAPVWRDLARDVSPEEFERVTADWIEGHFKQEYCFKLNEKPVAVLPLLPDNAAALIARAREQAAEAGLPGIVFIVFIPAGQARNAQFQLPYKEAGADLLYCDFSPLDDEPGKYALPYKDAVSESPAFWGRANRQELLPVIPNLSTGYDDTPLVLADNARKLTGRTPELFHRLCRSARQNNLSGRAGVVIAGPLNDWEHGSYIEPNREFGFGFYEAIRDNFGVKPPEGWPQNAYPPGISAE